MNSKRDSTQADRESSFLFSLAENRNKDPYIYTKTNSNYVFLQMNKYLMHKLCILMY